MGECGRKREDEQDEAFDCCSVTRQGGANEKAPPLRKGTILVFDSCHILTAKSKCPQS